MRAIDTNIVVRLIARDDERQVGNASALLHEPFILLPSVILESAWVLGTSYAMSRIEIVDSLVALARHPEAIVVSSQAVDAALQAFRIDGELADHLHVALAADAGATRFVTFDRRLTSRAATEVEIETLT
jgi:predicted nucleic-acid-binding protein